MGASASIYPFVPEAPKVPPISDYQKHCAKFTAPLCNIVELEEMGPPQFERCTTFCKEKFSDILLHRPAPNDSLDGSIWSRYEVKEGLRTLRDLLCTDVGYAIASTAGIPKHCVMVSKDADGKKKWAVRCVGSTIPMPISYRWGTAGCLKQSMGDMMNPVRCSDCRMQVQGAAGGMDPMSLPEGCFWVDHLCTSIFTVFAEMSRAAVLYYGGRLLAHSAERDGERGWLIWEKMVCALPIKTGRYEASQADAYLFGEVGYRLSQILKAAAAAPMYDKTDLFHICSKLHLVGAIVLYNWSVGHGWGSSPPMCKDPGKRLIPRDDPWFGDNGLFSNRINWNYNWVSARGIALIKEYDNRGWVGRIWLQMWWSNPEPRPGPFLVVRDLGKGYFRVVKVVEYKAENHFRSNVTPRNIRFLG